MGSMIGIPPSPEAPVRKVLVSGTEGSRSRAWGVRITDLRSFRL